MRKIKSKDLVGKTIKSINSKAVNVLKLTFTDGTKLEIESEVIWTPAGNLPTLGINS